MRLAIALLLIGRMAVAPAIAPEVRRIGFGPIDARITLQANQVVDADMELEIVTVSWIRRVVGR
jgi:hypothetical protein